MTLDVARRIADAVMYEGYVLYPYRASAAKNHLRFQFGVVVPKAYSEAHGSDPWFVQTECLLEAGTPADGPVSVYLRFLQLERRQVERLVGGTTSVFVPIDRIDVAGQALISWDEGIAHEIALPPLTSRSMDGVVRECPLSLGARRTVERVFTDAAGTCRVVRERWAIDAFVRMSTTRVGPVTRLCVRLENRTGVPDGGEASRERALRQACVGTHFLLDTPDAAFLSMLDPPDWAAEHVAACRNEHVWPVLVGAPASRTTMMAAPIVLYDYPAIAPESPGDLCDATEIDEILTLRVMTLTEEEKREAMATDPRSRAIVERSDGLPPEWQERLHGAIRELRPSPDDGNERFVQVGEQRVGKGSLVRLHPRARADTMDEFFENQVARVEGVFETVEQAVYVAVTLEDDPGADLQRMQGRFFYFFPQELEPVSDRTLQAAHERQV